MVIKRVCYLQVMFTTVICVENIRRIAAACFFSGFTQEIVLILLVQPYRTTVGIFDVYCILRSFHTLLASLVRISVVKRREAKQRVSERALTAGPIILAHVWVGALYAAECDDDGWCECCGRQRGTRMDIIPLRSFRSRAVLVKSSSTYQRGRVLWCRHSAWPGRCADR